ncbi:STN domain-containing protein [Variovorax sp. ZS18.2.2]|uniref:STN domain-containing protein n=1 Tax=Variovorax sp. ZS18.2.2 TaxID=2971255 RepID=UPI002151CD62|nr:STN domain-containing protein [Variovorax sp. ZS18.2.2]MCR6477777.1 STN domain-containing protein [Variovorax sp. ZS18.2.2]
MPVAGRYLLAGLMAMLGVCSVARGTGVQPAAIETEAPAVFAGRIRFDIPRQPLQSALARFHGLTGQSLLYDELIAEGRMAGPLQGEYTPEAALHRLLEGSGIVARYTSQAAFMLVREAAPEGAGSVPPAQDPEAPARAARQDYYGRLQARLVAVLCGDPKTIPGSYRLALNIWVGADNTVSRMLLHPTGDVARDARIRALLTGLALPAEPPVGLAQPVTLLVLPRQPKQTGDCRAPA